MFFVLVTLGSAPLYRCFEIYWCTATTWVAGLNPSCPSNFSSLRYVPEHVWIGGSLFLKHRSRLSQHARYVCVCLFVCLCFNDFDWNDMYFRINWKQFLPCQNVGCCRLVFVAGKRKRKKGRDGNKEKRAWSSSFRETLNAQVFKLHKKCCNFWFTGNRPQTTDLDLDKLSMITKPFQLHAFSSVQPWRFQPTAPRWSCLLRSLTHTPSIWMECLERMLQLLHSCCPGDDDDQEDCSFVLHYH